MATRTTPTAGLRAELSHEDKVKAIRRFENLSAQIQAFEPGTVTSANDPKITEFAAAARSAVEKTYPDQSAQGRFLSTLTSIEYAIPMYAGRLTPINEVQEALHGVKGKCLVLVRQAIADLKEDVEEQDLQPRNPQPVLTRKIDQAAFIVHGREEGPREAVARFLEQLGITPIILHEQANKGRTLIEKFEAHGSVPFAIVLMTADDIGGLDQSNLKPRARQNVILELGYFIGKLGRSRVCALKRGELEEPSDILGISYIEYDLAGGWRQKLAQELDAAGLAVDWNKVMKK